MFRIMHVFKSVIHFVKLSPLEFYFELIPPKFSGYRLLGYICDSNVGLHY